MKLVSTQSTNAFVNKVPILKAIDVHKWFPGVTALQGVNFEIFPGEVHALLGANGAGKSTLIKIISGYYAPDRGEIIVNGKKLTPNPAAVHALGIATIHQEHNLVPHMTVIDNVLLGRWPGRYGIVSTKKSREKARQAISRVAPGLDVEILAMELSPAEGQLVEIARALSEDAQILIMDEPTTSLSAREIERLFEVMRDLKSHGIGIVFVSHWLEEIFAISDCVTVFRDGRFIGNSPIGELDHDSLVRMMIGSDVHEQPLGRRSLGKEILNVSKLGKRGVLQDISLSLREGEILTITGLVGAGRTELVRCIFGIDEFDVGEVKVDDRSLPRNSPVAAIEAGIGFISEDRKEQGLVGVLNIRENLTLSILKRVAPFGLINRSKELKITSEQSSALRVKASSSETNIMTLSGGNQQKVIIGRWLAREPRILILDEPTKGIDIEAKAEIHRLIGQLAESGVAVLLVTSEMPEVMLLSDRVLVMREGKLVAEFDKSETTPEKIIVAATTEGV